jgi:hypothetical protein
VVNINVFGSTASSLTPELIAEKVREVLSYEAVEEGVSRMTEEVAPTLFVNEKGNSMIRVADAARKKLVYRTDTGDEPDPGGMRTGRLLQYPFSQAALLALDGTEKPDAVERTLETLRDHEACGKEALKTLLRTAPTQFEQPTSLITEVHDLANQRAILEIDKVLTRRRRARKKQQAVVAEQWRNELLDHAQDLHDGTFWHPDLKYIVQLAGQDDEIVILGRREKRGGTTMPLTKDGLRTISDLGLTRLLAAQYQEQVKLKTDRLSA